MSNKVRFGLKNVHYAILTETTNQQTGDITYSWAAPVAVPGAVNLDLSNESETNVFYADNVAYYTTVSATSYTGSLEMALCPDYMLQDIWGDKVDATSKVIYEGAANAKRFALLFQINGDENEDYYVLYNVTATRPGIGSQTVSDSVEVVTQSMDITAAALKDSFGTIQAHTTAETTSTVKDAWFTAVQYTEQT